MEKRCPNCGSKLEISTTGSHRLVGGEDVDDIRESLVCLRCSWTDDDRINDDEDQYER
jgi:hypothetical protein